MMLRLVLGLILVGTLIAAYPANSRAQEQEGALRFDVVALPGLQRYADLLAQPGFVAIILENNGLTPSQSSKLKIGEHGGSAEIRGGTLRFTGKKGAVYAYEAAYSLGLGDAKLSFPLAVDASTLASGKVTITLSPPFANLIPTELTDRIRYKMHAVANSSAQGKVLAYLDSKPKDSNLVEAILLDAYNGSGGPMVQGRDVGDAVPLSDQWLLIITLTIWLIALPLLLLVRRKRRVRAHSA